MHTSLICTLVDMPKRLLPLLMHALLGAKRHWILYSGLGMHIHRLDPCQVSVTWLLGSRAPRTGIPSLCNSRRWHCEQNNSMLIQRNTLSDRWLRWGFGVLGVYIPRRVPGCKPGMHAALRVTPAPLLTRETSSHMIISTQGSLVTGRCCTTVSPRCYRHVQGQRARSSLHPMMTPTPLLARGPLGKKSCASSPQPN